MSILKLLLTGIAGLMLAAPFAVALFSQQPAGIPAATPDPQIAAALREVSAARIQQTIEKLAQLRHPADALVGHAGFERQGRECGSGLDPERVRALLQRLRRLP